MTGQIIRAIVRHSGSTLPVSLSSYAVVGAAAFMGGATRLTLTATVMVMETTGSLQLIVPLMLTVFVAKVRGPPCLLAHHRPLMHYLCQDAGNDLSASSP